MHKPSADTPSSLVFGAARKIAEDMRDAVDSLSDDVVDYITMLANMADALKETKRNLERHVIPLHAKKSKERRKVRKKIQSIQHAIESALRLKRTLELTMDDINDVVKPGGWAPTTRDFLDKIMEPTDEELNDIDDIDLPPPDTSI
jgi:hypothetical protein